MEHWTREQAIDEYRKKVRGLQYTIGERDRLKALWALAAGMLSGGNGILVRKIMQLLSITTADRFQDVFALLFNGGKEAGYFVEFGACDGVFGSNTLTLERYFGWHGILAEPAKIWHDRLGQNRTVHIDKRCVSAKTGELLEFHEATSPDVSSLNRKHRFLGGVSGTYYVPTVSLTDLLADHGAPSFIDFLSVDVEGHEFEVLRTFDFGRYRFGFICVEQHAHDISKNSVAALLETAGYRAVFPRDHDKSRPPHMQITGVDSFFIAPGLCQQLEGER